MITEMAKNETPSLTPDQDAVNETAENQTVFGFGEDTLVPDFDQATESVQDAGVPSANSESDGGTSGPKKAAKSSKAASEGSETPSGE